MDATQDVFLQVLKLGQTPDHPSSYLYRAATHVCLNRIRSGRRKAEAPLDARDPWVEAIAQLPDAAERTGALMLLGRLFAAEQESTRTLAVLHYVDGWTLDEVAEQSGLSVSGVRKRLATLRTHLEALEGPWNA